jgi:hypothetical protein
LLIFQNVKKSFTCSKRFFNATTIILAKTAFGNGSNKLLKNKMTKRITEELKK